MKKLLAIILATVISFSLFACGGSGGSESTNSIEDKVENAVKNQLIIRISLQYDATVTNTTFNVDKKSENKYEVAGKVTARDKYADFYTGKYDAVVEYDPTTDTCKVTECSIDKLYKN